MIRRLIANARPHIRSYALAFAGCLMTVGLNLGSGCGQLAAADQPSLKTGTISGVIRYVPETDRPWRYSRYYVARNGNGELAETIVALRGRNLKKLAPAGKPRQHEIDQVGFQFTPETTVIRAGDTVRFTNSDSSLHNIKSDSPLATFNINLAQGEEHVQTFPRAGDFRTSVKLGCVFHGSMRAWVFVFDHPWFALTAQDGKYRLNEIPPGEYELHVLHPAGEFEFSQTVIVKAGQQTTLDVVLPGQQQTAESK